MTKYAMVFESKVQLMILISSVAQIFLTEVMVLILTFEQNIVVQQISL